MHSIPKTCISEDALHAFAAAVLRAAGVPADEADLVARVLVEADVSGVGSHGVARLPAYLLRLRSGGTSPVARIEVARDFPSGALLDGGNSMGQVVAARAMAMAVDKARTTGIALVTARNVQHTGANAHYVKWAADQGMIGLMMSNGPSGVAPWGSRTPFFATNPLSCGFPAGREPAVVIDMATSTASRGRIIQAARLGQTIPLGWAMDKDGNDTTDPDAALKGALLPFGGHKGYALSLAIEVLAGILSGAGFGPQFESHLNNPVSKSASGKTFIAVNIASFEPLAEFTARMDAMIGAIRMSEPRPGVKEVLLPGDMENRRAAERRCDGIPLPLPVVEDLVAEAARYAVASPFAA